MNWHVLSLSAEQGAGGVGRYQEAMEKSFTAARGPRTMAVFKRERDDGGVELFFTPECAQHAGALLKEWNCSPCERPSLIGLHLLVGHSEITYYMP